MMRWDITAHSQWWKYEWGQGGRYTGEHSMTLLDHSGQGWLLVVQTSDEYIISNGNYFRGEIGASFIVNLIYCSNCKDL